MGLLSHEIDTKKYGKESALAAKTTAEKGTFEHRNEKTTLEQRV